MSFRRNISHKYRKQLLDVVTEKGLDALKSSSKKLVHKTEFIGNKIADEIVKPKPVPDENSRNIEEIIIPPEKREEILNELRQELWNEIL